MVIDLKKASQTAEEMGEKIGTLREIILAAQTGRYTNKHVGNTAFTAQQKQTLTGKYESTKNKISALYKQLP